MEELRVYIHELVDIVGHRRGDYMRHAALTWAPIGRRERDQTCMGVWAVVGSTSRWPRVVNLWELASWEALGRNFDVELRGEGLQDPELAAWWAEASTMRSGGFDRILEAPTWSPSAAELHSRATDRPRAGYLHEIVTVVAGSDAELLERVRGDGIAAYSEAGFTLIGAYRRALANDDECVLIWAFPSWSVWADAMRVDGTAVASGDGPAAAIARWRRDQRDVVTGRRAFLLADAPDSPMRTGRTV
ncbi:MAG: hypothetical protein R2698_03445 [Microthrixaceae bacterium]